MGRYMTVVLKEQHKNDLFIGMLNDELANRYGANTCTKFNPWTYLEGEADYINNHPEGKKQLTDWKRPITKEQLNSNFFWFRHGEFSFKLFGGGATSDDARDAVAICKWIEATQEKYIDKGASDNYDRETVSSYLNYLFEEAGYTPTEIWEQPI